MFSPVCRGPVVWGRCGSSDRASRTLFSAAVSSTPPLHPSLLQHEALSLPAGQLHPQHISETQTEGWGAQLLLKDSHICTGPSWSQSLVILLVNWSVSVSERLETISYLVSEQIPDHFCVACGCRQVKGCHLVHVCVWETEHSCLPQIVHCNTGKDS